MIIAAALAQLQSSDRGRAAGSGILLLDEPTASLDLAYQLEIAALLRTLHQEQGVAIVLSTHDLNLASSLCRTLVLLRAGTIVALGPTSDILTRNEHPSALRRGRRDHSIIPQAIGWSSLLAHTGIGLAGMTFGRRLAQTLAAFGLMAAAAILLAPLVGSTSISLRRAFDMSIPFADNTDAQIFFVARLPRTLAGALVGATLAVAGVVFQGLLRNPLATPFTLGVSAGGALGAMLAITFDWTLGVDRHLAVPLAAFAGSLAAVGVVYALARARQRGLSTNVLLLAGVTLNAFFSALILFIQYFANFARRYRTLRWLMGNLDVSSYGPLLGALPLAVVAFVAFAWLARAAQPPSLGADSAESRGLDVARASGWHSSARRWRPAPRSRWAARSASSGLSCRIWSGSWSVRIIGSCFRPPRSSARRS